MSVDVQTRIESGVPKYTTLKLAVAVLAGHGQLPADKAMSVVNTGVKPGRAVREAMRPLVTAGVIELIDGVWYAPSVADLAAWVADGYADRADAGHADDPPIPTQRTRASAA